MMMMLMMQASLFLFILASLWPKGGVMIYDVKDILWWMCMIFFCVNMWMNKSGKLVMLMKCYYTVFDGV